MESNTMGESCLLDGHHGLGLPHVRNIAHHHGGDVRVEDDPSGGARVMLSVSA
jgi:signal transduction histidine kinase